MAREDPTYVSSVDVLLGEASNAGGALQRFERLIRSATDKLDALYHVFTEAGILPED